MSTVIGIHGNKVLHSKEPNEETVKCLEYLLEQAKSGEIVGVAAITCFYDDCSGEHAAGQILSYRSIGSLDCLKHKLIHQMAEIDG